MTTTRLLPSITAGCALLAMQGMAHDAFGQAGPSAPDHTQGATVAYTTELRATVEALDQTTREVLLRGPGGGLVSVVAGPDVRHLDRIRVGDQVVVRYVEALAASLARPDGTGASSVQGQAGILRSAPAGSRPGAVVGGQIRTTVQVEAVDRAKNTLTFVGPSGAVRTVAVRDPEAQRFLQTLNAGDRLDLVYTESLAVAVEPAPR